VVAAAWSRRGNSRKTAENTAGISTPPENPCTTRKPSSAEKSRLKAQPTEDSVNRPTAAANSQRSVSVPVGKPVSGIAITSAIK
jgi:hypothetical protein